MATLAEISAQLNEIKQIKTDIKAAINTNEVLITEDTPFSEYASKIDQSITAYGIDNLIGELNSNGELLAPTEKVLSFSKVTTSINDHQYRWFAQGLEKIIFSGITAITGYNRWAFGQNNIQTVNFSDLTTISGDFNFSFYKCNQLTKVYFPKLTTIGQTSIETAFNLCINLQEIHFKTDMQETVMALAGYSIRFGGGEKTVIYFDL